MATHITEDAAAAVDLPTLLARARAGEEIIVESESQPNVIIRSASPRRSISENQRARGRQFQRTRLRHDHGR